MNDNEKMRIADLNADEQNSLLTVRTEYGVEIAAADSFTGELAGTSRILRRGQNHREMPAGAAYHHKKRNKSRFNRIMFMIQ